MKTESSVKKNIIAHPFLFAVLPVLILFSANIDYIPSSQLFFSSLLTVGLAFAVVLIIRVFVLDWLLAGLFSSPLILGFLASGEVYEYLANILANHRYRLQIMLFAAIVVLASYLIYAFLLFGFRKSRKLLELNKIFNVIAAVLVLYNLSAVVFHRHKGLPAVIDNIKSLPRGEEKPDIYFIVLDQFAGLKEIKDVFGYDNSVFVKRLATLGFYVPRDAKTRYLDTDASLADTFNMGETSMEPDGTLTTAPNGQIIAKESDRKKMYAKQVIRENKVARILKSFGYKFVNIGGGYSDTSYNANADENFNCFGFRCKNELNDLLVRSSFLRFALISRKVFRDTISCEFDRLSKTPLENSPKFVFAHILCPHLPFVFGPNGEEIPIKFSRNFRNKQLYLGQYIFASKMAEDTVSTIISRSKTPPVIILVSDHGSKESAEYAHSIFCALHLPNNGKTKLSQRLASRNIFRIILDYYFGQDLSLLAE